MASLTKVLANLKTGPAGLYVFDEDGEPFTYEPGTIYRARSVVKHNGRRWIAKIQTDEAPSGASSSWALWDEDATALIGELSLLPTEDKDNLVAALVEALSTPYLRKQIEGAPGLKSYFGAKLDGNTSDSQALNDAIEWSAEQGASSIEIPAATIAIEDPLRLVSWANVRVHPKARLLQRGPALISQADNTAVTGARWVGGMGVYSVDSPSKLHAMLDMQTHNQCEIKIRGEGYTDQILARWKGKASGNTVFNQYDIEINDSCRMAFWLQGLERYYTEHQGDGVTTDFATDFDNIKWPADLVLGLVEASTGELRRLIRDVDYTIISGAAGILGTATVRLAVAPPATDTLMMWPGTSTNPRSPISNNEIRFVTRTGYKFGFYGVRYADAMNIRGRGKVIHDHGRDFVLNVLGERNAEIDYFDLHNYVSGNGAPNRETVHYMEIGPGARDIKGTGTPDNNYPGGVFLINDQGDVPATGTVSIDEGGTVVTGVGTKFTEEFQSIGNRLDNIYFVATGTARRVASVDSDTQITIVPLETPVPAASGSAIRRQNTNDEPTVHLIITRGDEGTQTTGVSLYKSGSRCAGKAFIPAGQTQVSVPYPWRLNRQPFRHEVRLTMISSTSTVRVLSVGNMGAANFTVNMTSTAGIDIEFGYEIDVSHIASGAYSYTG